jgi:drug/metabolite transporter (DMT)-like permease
MKGAILCPLVIVVGAMYAALGERAKAIIGTREDPSWLAWVICIPLVVAGVLLYLWPESELERRGYQF